MSYAAFGDGRNYSLLVAADANPEALSGYGKLYSKRVGGVTQLFYLSDDGTVHTITPPSAGNVTSVFSRTGVVVAASGDYNTDQITNNSGVAGVSTTAALNQLEALISVKAPANFGSRTVTAATDTVLAADNNQIIRGNRATQITFTVPGATIAAGSTIGFFQEGAGKLTLSASGGLSIVSEGGLLSSSGTQNAYMALFFLTTNLAILAGSRGS